MENKDLNGVYNRAPIFDGDNYDYCKECMSVIIILTEDEMLLLFRCDVLRKLFMHVELIEEVTSKSFAWFVLFA